VRRAGHYEGQQFSGDVELFGTAPEGHGVYAGEVCSSDPFVGCTIMTMTVDCDDNSILTIHFLI
jgi:hypothetical protein